MEVAPLQYSKFRINECILKGWILIIVYQNYLIMKEKVFEFFYWFQNHEWEDAKICKSVFIGLMFFIVWCIYTFPKDGIRV